MTLHPYLYCYPKVYGLPGLRVGWLATKDKALMKRVKELRDYTTICNSAPSEILALMGLRASEQIISRNMEVQSRTSLRSHPSSCSYPLCSTVAH